MNTKRAPLLLLACVATLMLAAAPAHSKDSTCGFRATGLGLTFGALDPSNAVQVVRVVQAVNAGAGTVGDCDTVAGTLTISIVGATSRQLSNGAGGTIPYTLAGFPITMGQPGNKVYANFLSAALTGTIAAGAYADAPAGAYTDTVTISVSP
jgi:hypothetical protein